MTNKKGNAVIKIALIICIQSRQLLKPKKLKHLDTIHEPKREAANHCVKNDDCGG